MKRILFLTAVIVSCSAATVSAQSTTTSTSVQRVEQPSDNRSINDDQSIRTRGVGTGATINSRGVSDPTGMGPNTTGAGANTTDNVLNRDPSTRNIPLDTAPNAMGAQGTGTGTDSDIFDSQANTGTSENRGNFGQTDVSGTVSGRTNSDRALSTRIRQDLMNNDQIAQNLDSIRINSENGRVTLLGTVNSEEERQQIINEVQSIAGVSTIDDRLRIERN